MGYLAGSPQFSSVPQQMNPGHDWIGIAAGDIHSVALRRDGTVWAWGDNSVCQMGNGPGPTQPISSRSARITIGQPLPAARAHTRLASARMELFGSGARSTGWKRPARRRVSPSNPGLSRNQTGPGSITGLWLVFGPKPQNYATLSMRHPTPKPLPLKPPVSSPPTSYRAAMPSRSSKDSNNTKFHPDGTLWEPIALGAGR